MSITESKRTRQLRIVAIITSGLLLATVLLARTYVECAAPFAEHKPGLWGEPAWYIVLMLAGEALVVTILINATLIAFGATSRAVYKRHVLLLIGVAVVRGLFYSSITPPWQSPDEHAHFEYAALFGQLRRVPTLDDISPELQQQIVSSMFDHNFWQFIRREPVASPPVGFLSQGGITREPPTHVVDDRYLYYPQVGKDPPLYYIAPAVVYAAFPSLDTALQLYLMRLTTVVTFASLVGVVIWATRQLFGNDMLLAVSIPTLIAFHPMLAHMGSVLNNDVLAALITTTLLGTLVIILRYGLTWRRGAIVAGLVVLGLLTKKSTLWTIPLIGSIGLVDICRRKIWVRYVILAGMVTVLSLSLVLLRIPSEQARYWTPVSSSWGATVTHKSSPDGAYALRVAGGGSTEGMLGQRLSAQTALDLRGHTVALSAQVRTDSGTRQGDLAVVDLDHAARFGTNFSAGPEWRNVTLQFTVPDDALHLQVVLVSTPQSTIYFDQVALIDLSDPDVAPGLPRNGSAEQVLTLGEIAAVGAGKWLGFGGVVQRVFDSGQANFHKLLLNSWPTKLAFESFWGNFGAALVVPLPASVYRVLKYACGLGALGIGWYTCRTIAGREKAHPAWEQHSLLVLGGALLFSALSVFTPLFVLEYRSWSPQGRYLFPAIWPIGIFLVLGWAQWMPGRTRSWALIGLTIGMITLDCVALRQLAVYFYGL
jgi:hypothetical protein